MKLKKSIKIILILFLFGGIIIGGYYFNRWFFSNFKTTRIIDEEENIIEKEIIEVKNEVKNDNDFNKKNKTKKTNEKKKIRTIKMYYCLEGDTLVDEDKCETTIEKDAIKMELKFDIENKKKYAIEFDINAWANEYDVNFTDVVDILTEVCKKETNGNFEVNYDTNIGKCYFSDEDEKPTYTYRCLDSSYELNGTKCTKTAKVSAKVKYGCPDGFTEDGIYCIED